MVNKKVRPRRTAPARWTRRPEERPQEILDAALRVFAARGCAATRLADIATAAGVTKGTIYYYFKDKDAVFERLVAAHEREIFDTLDASLADAAGPASVTLRMVLRRGFCQPVDEARRLMHRVFTDVHAAEPKLFGRIVQNSLVAGWTLIARLIARGQASGEFRRDADAEVAARVFTSGLLLQQLWRETLGLDTLDPFDRDRMVDSTIELFLHSLRPTVRLRHVQRAAGGKRRARTP
jgi:AcrR family transcriptional regulator